MKKLLLATVATLAIAASPAHGENSVLRSLPTSVQKSIKEIRERCLAIERENPPYGTADDDGLIRSRSQGHRRSWSTN
jgi:hypothetical protein